MSDIDKYGFTKLQCVEGLEKFCSYFTGATAQHKPFKIRNNDKKYNHYRSLYPNDTKHPISEAVSFNMNKNHFYEGLPCSDVVLFYNGNPCSQNGISKDKFVFSKDAFINSGCFVSSLLVEFDGLGDNVERSPYENKKILWDKIHNLFFLQQGFQPTFIVESYKGFHCHFLIHPDDRVQCSKIIDSIPKRTVITQGLAKKYGSDMQAEIYKTGRAPYTLNSTDGGFCGLFEFQTGVDRDNAKHLDWNEFEKKTISYLSFNDINRIYTYFKQEEVEEDKIEKDRARYGNEVRSKIQDVKIASVINSTLEYSEGKQTFYKVGMNGVSIEEYRLNRSTRTWDGPDLTSGYKINIENNYVNNFSGEEKNRPRGGPYHFMKMYLGSAHAAIQYFKDKFGIDIGYDETTSEIQKFCFPDQVASCNGNDLLLGSKQVILNTMTKGGKNSKKVSITLCNCGLYIHGRTMTKYDPKGFENEKEEEYYVISVNSSPKKHLMKMQASKAMFNIEYAKIGLCFQGDSDYVHVFFECIREMDLPTLSIIYKTSVNNEFVSICGWPVRRKEGTEKRYHFVNERYNIEDIINFNLQDCGPKFFLDTLRTLRSRNIADIAFLSAIMMASGDVLDSYYDMTGKPKTGVHLRGFTKAGKSTLAQIMLNMIGYCSAGNPKRMPMESTTGLPFKIHSIDPGLMIIDEVQETKNEVSITRKQMMLRDILNRSVIQSGMGSGIKQYSANCWIFSNGQATYSQESINNRFIIIPISQQDRISSYGNPDDIIRKILQYTCKEWIRKFWRENGNSVMSRIESCARELKNYKGKTDEFFFDDRYQYHYGVLLAIAYEINKMCIDQLFIDTDELMQKAEHCVIGSGMNPPKSNPMLDLKKILFELQVKKMLISELSYDFEGKIQSVDLYLMSETAQMRKPTIMQYIHQLQGTEYEKMISMYSDIISVNLDHIMDDITQKMIYKFIQPFVTGHNQKNLKRG